MVLGIGMGRAGDRERQDGEETSVWSGAGGG